MRGVRRGPGATAVATVMLMAVTGCTGAPGTGAVTPSAPSGTPIELTVLTYPAINTPTMANVNQEFTATHPGVKIRLKEELDKPLSSSGQVNAGVLDGVDIALLPDTVLAPAVEGNLLKDLSAVKLPPPNELLSGFWNDLGKVNGKQFGLPVAIAPSMIMLNDPALQKAGIKDLPLEWTWQDFEQAIRTAKAAGVPTAVQLSGLVEPVIRSYGGLLYDSDKGAYAFDTTEAKQGLGALQQLVKTGAIQTDKSALQIGFDAKGPAFVFLSKLIIGPAQMRQMPLPKGPKGRPAPVSATYAAVTTHSSHAELATEYVKALLSSPAVQLELAKGGVFPATRDAKAMAAWQQAMGDQPAAAVQLAFQDGYVAPPARYPRFDEAIAGLLPYLNGSAALDPTVTSLMRTLAQ